MPSLFTVRRIENAVKRLKRQYDAADPYEIAGRMDIMVEYHEYPRLLGFCCKVLGNTVIALNSRAPRDERRCVCAHELGHIVLGHIRSEGFTTMHYCELSNLDYWFEAEANCFAAALLIDDEELMDALDNYDTAERMAANLRVCPEILQAKMDMMRTRGKNVPRIESTGRAWRRG